MIKLYECTYTTSSKSNALTMASDYTGFSATDFKCKILKQPQRVGLFKKEDGVFNCWYEYMGMNADKVIDIADSTLYFDTAQKKILVVRLGYKAYEVDYSRLIGYEIVVADKHRTYTVQKADNALKGAIMFGTIGAIVGAAHSTSMTDTVKLAELIIRLKFKEDESFDILTCSQQYETAGEEWRNIVEQTEEIVKWFNILLD